MQKYSPISDDQPNMKEDSADGSFYWCADADARIQQLENALRAAKRSHYSCDDCWYSCPKSEDGCCNKSQGPECNCGADEHNARIDAVLKGLAEEIA
jgi:hypothetical protein